jgi:hypothetical protein
MNSLSVTRRRFLTRASQAAMAGSLVRAASRAEESVPRGRAEHCILLWLGGGMCHMDTFDPKRLGDPATRKVGSAYPSIDTVVPGVQVCEHLPQCANVMDRMTVLRTVFHNVIDEHAAAVNRVHTGRPVSGTVQYPSIGSVASHELGAAADGVPSYVVIGYPNLAREPGFLGAKCGYLYLTDTESGPAGLSRSSDLTVTRQARRESLLNTLRDELGIKDSRVAEYDAAISESQRLSGPKFMRVFDLKEEKGSLREAYGSEFGQRCLLARRLIESGTRFIEVSHNLNFINGTGWDTHNEGQKNQHILIKELDNALATLISDLESRKLLDKTLVVVASEFGRPPEFDGRGGRGHHSKAFSVVLAGGGLNHCGAWGQTDELGKLPVTDPVSIPNLHATIHSALGIDPAKELYDGDRPVPITDGGKPVRELFG